MSAHGRNFRKHIEVRPCVINERLRDELVQILRESGLKSVDDCEDDPPISTQLRNFIDVWSADPSKPVNAAWGMAEVLTANEEVEPARRAR